MLVTSVGMLLAAGCAAETAPNVRRFVEDGVEVVASESPAWSADDAWRVSAEPVTTVGEDPAAGPEYLFSFIRGGRLGPGGLGPVRLGDGQIVAGDSLAVEIRYYDAQGTFVRAAGGPGQGPEEMEFISEVHRCRPETVTVIDGGRDELIVLDATGQFQKRTFFEQNAGRALYTPLSCNDNGQLLAMDWGDALGGSRDPGLFRSTVHILLLDPEGFVIHDFGAFPGVDRLQTAGGNGPHPLGKTPARALGTGRAYIGTADTFEIGVWSLDGELQQVWRRERGIVEPIEAGDIDAFIDEQIGPPEIATELGWYRERFVQLDLPEFFPAYVRFQLDAGGYLWVERFRTPRNARHLWSVFDPDGVWLGDVEVPQTFDITDIGDDYVLGVYRDELDEQSIRMYALERG